MANWKKGIVPGIGIFGSLVAFVLGSNARSQVDTGRTTRVTPQSYIADIESTGSKVPQIPEGELFYQLLLLLERDYVDPNIDEQKLAIGAIKGAVNGLWDPLSQYLTKDQFAERKRRMAGEFGGAGLELKIVIAQSELTNIRKGTRPEDPLALLPSIEVATVLPGSAAERAGIKVGDTITGVNNKWLLNYEDVKNIRKLQEAVAAGKMTAEQFKPARMDFQKRARAGVSIARAIDLLESGKDRRVSVFYRRNGKEFNADVQLSSLRLPSIQQAEAGVLTLRAFTGVSAELAKLDLKSINSIDMRESTLGDATEIKPILQLLAHSGKFGIFATERTGEPRTLATTSGTSNTYKFNLIVDRSTRGAAAVIALALQARGIGTLQGALDPKEAAWIETIGLSDGSGYTLNVGRFESGKNGESS